MLSINQKKLKDSVKTLVSDFYKADDVDIASVVADFDKDKYEWITSFLHSYVYSAVIQYELQSFSRIMIDEKDEKANKSCVTKKYSIVKELTGRYGTMNKFILKGDKTAKVTYIWTWGESKKELYDTISNEFNIAKRAGMLGISPKCHDTFVCCSSKDDSCRKVIVSEYIRGESLEEWNKKEHSAAEKKLVSDKLKAKMDLMHSHGIIHNNLHPGNVIIELYAKGKLVKNVYLTDFQEAFDLGSRKAWDNNRFIKDDRSVLKTVYGKDRYSNNISDAVTFVAVKLIKGKQIKIN
jgi:serine/threonine protein kinase